MSNNNSLSHASLQFLPEHIFLSKPLSLILLCLHLGTLAYLARQWLQGVFSQVQRRIFLVVDPRLVWIPPDYIVYAMCVSNFVGIVFARTLHYQFYSWYVSTVPLILWTNRYYSVPMRLVFMSLIEYAFLVYPATPKSSALLQLAHAGILWSILRQTPQSMDMPVIRLDNHRYEQLQRDRPTLRVRRRPNNNNQSGQQQQQQQQEGSPDASNKED